MGFRSLVAVKDDLEPSQYPDPFCFLGSLPFHSLGSRNLTFQWFPRSDSDVQERWAFLGPTFLGVSRRGFGPSWRPQTSSNRLVLLLLLVSSESPLGLSFGGRYFPGLVLYRDPEVPRLWQFSSSLTSLSGSVGFPPELVGSLRFHGPLILGFSGASVSVRPASWTGRSFVE